MAPKSKPAGRGCVRITVIAVALSLLAAPAVVLAAPAAVDEYSLGTSAGPREDPGPDVQIQPDEGGPDGVAPPPGTLGVLGEDAATESPLDAVGSGTVLLILLAVVVLGAVAIAYPREGSRPR